MLLGNEYTGTCLYEDVPVAILVKSVRVHKFKFASCAIASLILRNKLLVRKTALGVLVQELHVGVGWGGIEVIVQFLLRCSAWYETRIMAKYLDIFTVIALGASHAKKTFLENGIFPVPEGKTKAHPLVVVRHACDAILSPTVRSGSSLFVRKGAPRITVE